MRNGISSDEKARSTNNSNQNTLFIRFIAFYFLLSKVKFSTLLDRLCLALLNSTVSSTLFVKEVKN